MSRRRVEDGVDSTQSHVAEGRLPLKGFHLQEREWSPWYVDDFGLRTMICWERASDRSILIHNLAAAPDETEPEQRFVHLVYEVDLVDGRKSAFEIRARYLEGLDEKPRRHLLQTLERAIALATSEDPAMSED
ncbi:MAG: hypothetical protein AAGN66_23780 [Acidobacteriota bacterium]